MLRSRVLLQAERLRQDLEPEFLGRPVYGAIMGRLHTASKIGNREPFAILQRRLMGDDTGRGVGDRLVDIDGRFSPFDQRGNEFMRQEGVRAPVAAAMSKWLG